MRKRVRERSWRREVVGDAREAMGLVVTYTQGPCHSTRRSRCTLRNDAIHSQQHLENMQRRIPARSWGGVRNSLPKSPASSRAAFLSVTLQPRHCACLTCIANTFHRRHRTANFVFVWTLDLGDLKSVACLMSLLSM